MSRLKPAAQQLLLAGFCSCLCGAPESLKADGRGLDVPDLMKEARRTQRADFEAWSSFSFHRRVVRQRLDEEGVAIRSEVLEFEVTASETGFDEELVRIDGRGPLASEVRDHRRAGRFAKHHGQVRSEGEVDQRQGFSLAWLTQFPSYRYAGTETVGGVECHRLDFEPGMAGQSGSTVSRVPSRFIEVMAGSLWISSQGRHLVRGQVRTLRPVKLSLGVVQIVALDVLLEARPVAAEVWLPVQITVQTHLSILGRDVRKRNSFTYSRFSQELALAADD